jgi:hypothetical protein
MPDSAGLNPGEMSPPSFIGNGMDAPPGIHPHEHLRVLVGLTIGADGKVYDPEIVLSSDPDPSISKAVLKGVSQDRFHPARIDGRPVEKFVLVEIDSQRD